MNRKWLTIRRSLVLLALGGTTFGLFGSTFGAGAPGACNFANYSDYSTMYTSAGKAAIQIVSDTYFDLFPTYDSKGNPTYSDWDKVVRIPTTTFAQSVWANWVSTRVPDDIPNNPIVKR